jgi:hypothetical protein
MVDSSVFIAFERRGLPIELSGGGPSEDVMILLTDNADEFSRVPNLKVIRFGEGIRE